jgi:hypothetical protein
VLSRADCKHGRRQWQVSVATTVRSLMASAG